MSSTDSSCSSCSIDDASLTDSPQADFPISALAIEPAGDSVPNSHSPPPPPTVPSLDTPSLLPFLPPEVLRHIATFLPPETLFILPHVTRLFARPSYFGCSWGEDDENENASSSSFLWLPHVRQMCFDDSEMLLQWTVLIAHLDRRHLQHQGESIESRRERIEANIFDKMDDYDSLHQFVRHFFEECEDGQNFENIDFVEAYLACGGYPIQVKSDEYEPIGGFLMEDLRRMKRKKWKELLEQEECKEEENDDLIPPLVSDHHRRHDIILSQGPASEVLQRRTPQPQCLSPKSKQLFQKWTIEGFVRRPLWSGIRQTTGPRQRRSAMEFEEMIRSEEFRETFRRCLDETDRNHNHHMVEEVGNDDLRELWMTGRDSYGKFVSSVVEERRKQVVWRKKCFGPHVLCCHGLLPMLGCFSLYVSLLLFVVMNATTTTENHYARSSLSLAGFVLAVVSVVFFLGSAFSTFLADECVLWCSAQRRYSVTRRLRDDIPSAVRYHSRLRSTAIDSLLDDFRYPLSNMRVVLPFVQIMAFFCLLFAVLLLGVFASSVFSQSTAHISVVLVWALFGLCCVYLLFYWIAMAVCCGDRGFVRGLQMRCSVGLLFFAQFLPWWTAYMCQFTMVYFGAKTSSEALRGASCAPVVLVQILYCGFHCTYWLLAVVCSIDRCETGIARKLRRYFDSNYSLGMFQSASTAYLFGMLPFTIASILVSISRVPVIVPAALVLIFPLCGFICWAVGIPCSSILTFRESGVPTDDNKFGKTMIEWKQKIRTAVGAT